MRKIVWFFIKLNYRIKTRILKINFKLLFGKKLQYGKSLFFRKRFHIKIENGFIQIGSFCFFNNDCSINSLNEIKIGNHCIFGENVKIYDHNHKFDSKGLIGEQGYKTSKITIGDNCWIGSNVVILSKANIGKNCVIGAGVIVNETIPDDSLVTMEKNIKIVKRIYEK